MLPQPPEQSAGGVNVVLQADGDHGFLHEWCRKKKVKQDALFVEHTRTVKCNEFQFCEYFTKKKYDSESLLQPTKVSLL